MISPFADHGTRSFARPTFPNREQMSSGSQQSVEHRNTCFIVDSTRIGRAL